MERRAENDNVIIKVNYDIDGPDPRKEWDNIGTMICWDHKRDLGDDHSYLEPRDFLKDLAEGSLDTELGKKLLQQTADKIFDYAVVQNQDGQYLLLHKVTITQENLQELEDVNAAEEKINEIKSQMISDEYTGIYRERYLQRTLAGENVMPSIREKIDRENVFEIIQMDGSYYLYNQNVNRGTFEDEVFDSKEEALDHLEEEKEDWMEREGINALSYSQINQLIELEHVVLPIYLLEHSDIALRTSDFNDPWDSGQVGYIYATKEKLIKETGYSEDELFNTDKHRIPVIGDHVKAKGFENKGWEGFGKIKEINGNQVTIDFEPHRSPEYKNPENIVTVSLEDITEVMSGFANEILKGEVEVYEQYLRGDIYWYLIEKKTTCECCGDVKTEHIDSCGGFFGYDPFENGMKDHINEEYHDLLRELA